MGWNYALGWLVILPLELTACGITIQYWTSKINVAVFITIFLFVIIFINLCGVRGYGEAEVLFSTIKLIAVFGFMIVSIVIDCGGAPVGGYLGFKTWSDPGAFANGFKGVCSVFVTAGFAFSGTELVGLAAAECEDPKKTMPRATKQVFWRITLFYIVSLFLVGLIVPYNNPQLLNSTSSVDIKASPFVIAIQNAGINVLPSIFNAVILISVLSVGNSSTYGSTRTLCALADIGQAPRFLARVDQKGRPTYALLVSLAFAGLAYINVADVGPQVFNWLVAISGLSAFFTWYFKKSHMSFITILGDLSVTLIFDFEKLGWCREMKSTTSPSKRPPVCTGHGSGSCSISFRLSLSFISQSSPSEAVLLLRPFSKHVSLSPSSFLFLSCGKLSRRPVLSEQMRRILSLVGVS